MQTVFVQRAGDLPPGVIPVIERLLGRPVATDEEVSVAAVPAQMAPPARNRAEAARNLEALLERRADALAERASGVSDADLDSVIEEAVSMVRQRSR